MILNMPTVEITNFFLFRKSSRQFFIFKIIGIKTNAPKTSPIHQVVHTVGYAAQGVIFKATRARVPIDALDIGANNEVKVIDNNSF